MNEMVMKLDELGRPAWIALMVVSFVLFWPIGLAVLAFLLWSGRMSCGSKSARGGWSSRMADWGCRTDDREGVQRAWSDRSSTSGNRAFDEYREATLKRLEDEQRAFRDFLDSLRQAKDRAEFDQFMAERKTRAGSGAAPDGAPQSP